ncbi:hypothetical protein GBF38_000010 [Nibea albiflora]|nr:hypothetical protein GBF38_000010 [Nibea albiflora]
MKYRQQPRSWLFNLQEEIRSDTNKHAAPSQSAHISCRSTQVLDVTRIQELEEEEIKEGAGRRQQRREQRAYNEMKGGGRGVHEERRFKAEL